MDELWDEFFDEDGDAAAVVYWRRGDPPELWPTARAQIIEDERRFFLSEMAMILPDLRWWEGHVARSRAAVREFGESTFWAKALERAVPEMWDLRRRLGRAVKGLRKLERPGYLDKCPF